MRTEVYGSEAIKEDGGQWSIERVKDIAKEGGKVSEMADEVVLRNLYRKELEKKVTDGERWRMPMCLKEQEWHSYFLNAAEQS